MSDNPVVHFEMPYEDGKRVSEFYSKAFGWKMNMTGEDMGNYVIAETTETEGMKAVGKGAINGGFYQKSASDRKYPSVVISVADIQAAMKNVTDAGGKILGEVMDIPNVGKFVSFEDTEGNGASLLQAG